MSAEIIAALHAIVGDAGLKTGDTDTESFLTDWHGQYRGRSLAVVMPETTEQVSQVMALADAHDIVVVPQGGNTGFMGGATPDDAGNSILLSLRRMNRIREIDATNMSMTVEAGCVLQTLHDTTEKQGLYFPLNLAARKLHHRRQSGDQCRRAECRSLRNNARADPWCRGGADGRPRPEPAWRASQGQYGL